MHAVSQFGRIVIYPVHAVQSWMCKFCIFRYLPPLASLRFEATFRFLVFSSCWVLGILHNSRTFILKCLLGCPCSLCSIASPAIFPWHCCWMAWSWSSIWLGNIYGHNACTSFNKSHPFKSGSSFSFGDGLIASDEGWAGVAPEWPSHVCVKSDSHLFCNG